MTRAQKQSLIAVTIVVALTRWWAMSATLWDWDEALFSAGVRSFDVVAHHPHPPGFPFYVLAGKAVNLLVHDEFRALQLVNLAAAVVLFPLLVLMALTMGFSFPVALGGSLICVFAPNVWFFGGTAFSDIPSLALVVGTCAALFGSRTSGPTMFLAGALVLGLAAGVRSQNLLVGFVPFVLAAREQLRAGRWRSVAAGVLITATLTIGSYVGAGLASSSWADYQWTLREHRQYILRTDMVGSPKRPPLHDVTDDFFVRDFGFFRVGLVIVALSIVSLVHAAVRRNPSPILLLLTFGPFAVVAWLVLDYHSASRFSIGYLPLFAILAADGLEVLSRFLRVRERLRGPAVVVVSMLMAAALVVWAAPAINEARTSVTPTMAAVRWIRANLSPENVTLYVSDALIRMAGYLLPEYRIIRVLDERAVAMPDSDASRGYVLAEGATDEPSGLNFLRSRKSRLWRIGRPRYFEVSIIPLARRAQFLEGWHELENIGADTWRWMGRRSVTVLPAQPPPAQLKLTLAVPDGIPLPVISLRINGRLLDQFRAPEKQIERSYVVGDSRANVSNELVIETDQWVNPQAQGISSDRRDLGLRLQDMSWGPGRHGS